MNTRTIALSIAALCAAASALGFECTIDGYTYSCRKLGDGTVTIEKRISASMWGGWTYYPAIDPSPSGDYAIPDMLYDSATSNWYPVAAIGPMTAFSATTLTRLTFPNTVTSIDYESFRGAANLVEVAFPNSLKSIGNSAFEGTALADVILPSGVTRIGNSAFTGCTSLTNVVLPDGLEIIGRNAFSTGFRASSIPACTNLTEIVIPSSVTNIGERAFAECTGLRRAEIGGGAIGASAFSGCTSLETVTMGADVTSIGQYAFSGCTSLVDVVVGDGVSEIPATAFRDLPNLRRVVIGAGVLSIPGEAFSGCARLEVVEFQNGLVSIGDSAFASCAALKSVNIPNSVTNIGRGAFAESGLLSIRLPEGLVEVSDEMFYGCENLTSATMGNNVLTVGSGAFNGCTSLVSVVFGRSVRSIGSNAFYGCTALGSVTLPEGLRELGDSDYWYNPGFVFENCTSLTNLSIPNGVVMIGSGTFLGCTDLNYDTTTIPGLVMLDGYIIGWEASFFPANGHLDLSQAKGMVDGALEGCEEILSVKIPATWSRIPNFAFADCRNLVEVDMPDTIKHIGVSSFSGCSALSAISIPSGVTYFGPAIFPYSAIEEIVIPDDVEVVAEMFCAQCFALTNAIVGSGVNQIDSRAFADCPQLATIVFMGDAPTLNDTNGGAFSCVEYFNPVETTVYVSRGSTGWNTAIPGTWHGMRIEYLPLADDPSAYEMNVRGGGTALQEAIERAPEGATILVGRGTYTPIWTQGKSLYIKAVEGPDKTIIDGNNTNRCTTLASYPGNYGQNTSTNTVLDGFTLQNGAAYPYDGGDDGGGGVYGGTVQNCIIRQCSAIWGSGAIDSVLRNTMIVGCYADDNSTVAECDLENCLVINNLTGNGPAGLYNCFAENCTIASNRVVDANYVTYHDGGYWPLTGGAVGVCRGLLKNCVIWDNYAIRASTDYHYDPETGDVYFTFLDNVPINYDCCMLERCFTMPVPKEELLESEGEDGWITTGWDTSRRIPCHFEPGQSDDETATPRFVDERSGDFRLRFDSPCIDAGKSVPLSGDADLGGSLRVVGRAIDIGCYEFQRMIDIPSVGEDAGRPLSVPMDFIDQKAAPILAAHGGDYEATVLATTSNGVNKVWECYVAGLNPTNATDVFRVEISMDGGKPVIGWTPDLNEGGTKQERVYTVEGRSSLTEGDWEELRIENGELRIGDCRFFRVKVALP